MRQFAFACLVILGAAAAFAASPYYLDQNGVLWQGSSNQNGLLLTATRDGQQIVQSLVPFAVGIAGSNDTQIQVAADNLTGKVAVVWQRNWGPGASEIMLAVWQNGDWLRVDHLSQDIGANPRNPAVQLTDVSITVPDPSAPTDPTKATIVHDSFVNVIWWEGTDGQHGSFASLRLTADPDDTTALLTRNLDDLLPIGLGCGTPVPAAVMEHPTFGVQPAHDRADLLFATQNGCIFPLVEISYILDPSQGKQPSSSGGGFTAGTQRRRSMPIFGLMRVYAMPLDLGMNDVRVVLGKDLNPVAYRVDGANATIQYVTATPTGWSPLHTLPVANGLTLDQAIPLVENLAR